MLRAPLDDAQPIGEVAGELAADYRGAEVVQLRLLAQRINESLQPFPPGIRAEIGEAGLLARLFDRAVGVEVDRGHRTSANLTTVACGVSTSSSGRKNR